MFLRDICDQKYKVGGRVLFLSSVPGCKPQGEKGRTCLFVCVWRYVRGISDVFQYAGALISLCFHKESLLVNIIYGNFGEAIPPTY